MVTIPRLTAISPGLGEIGPSMENWLHALAGAGVEGVQIREKTIEDRDLFRLVSRAVSIFNDDGQVLVNGRADVALAAEAAGVHLPEAGLPTSAARRLLGRRRLIGRSTHTAEAAVRALGEGADFVYLSPIFATPGKGAPIGLEELRRAAACGGPIIALGGITIDRLEEVATAGAAGVAGIRMTTETRTLQALVDECLRVFARQ